MQRKISGRIKKGVDFRISEIADYSEPNHPGFRPKYVHLMPLAELISTVYDKGVTTKTVQGKWRNLVDVFGTEIDVLINASLEDISKIDLKVANVIESFRNNTIEVVPGGGGQYGHIVFNESVKKSKATKTVTLDNF